MSVSAVSCDAAAAAAGPELCRSRLCEQPPQMSPTLEADAQSQLPAVRNHRSHHPTSLALLSVLAAVMLLAVLLPAGARADNVPGTTDTLRIAVLVYDRSNVVKLPDNYNTTEAAYFVDNLFFEGYQLWRNRVNEMGGILVQNTSYAANVTFFNFARPPPVATNDTDAIPLAVAFAYQLIAWGHANPTDRFPFMIMPQGASYAMTIALMRVCEATHDCIMINPFISNQDVFVCPDPLPQECADKHRRVGQKRFDYGFGVLPAGITLGDPFMPVIQSRGAKRLAIITSTSQVVALAKTITPETITVANSVGIEVPIVYYLPSAEGVASVESGKAILRNVSSYEPDSIMIFSALPPPDIGTCINLIKAFLELDYMPTSLFIGGGCLTTTWRNDPLIQSQDLTRYIYSSLPWDDRVRGVEYRAKAAVGTLEPFAATDKQDSPAVFAQMLVDRFGKRGDRSQLLVGALGALACILIQKSIENVGATGHLVADDMVRGSTLISSPSHYGHIGFDIWNRQADVNRVVVQMSTYNSYNLLTPNAAGVEPVYPIPTWKERVYNPSFYAQTSEKVMLVVNTIALAYVLLLLVVMIRKRNHKVVVAATPVFCWLTIIGAMMLLSAVYVWMLHESNATCTSKLWLLQLGFTLMIGSVVIKTLRLWYILEVKQIEYQRLSTGFLLGALGALLAFEVAYTAIWQEVAPLSAWVVQVDADRPSRNYASCSYNPSFPEQNTAGTVFVVVSLVIKGLLVFVAALAAWRTRRVLGDYNESLQIGISVWNLLILLIIGVPVVFATSDRYFQFYVRCSGLILLCVATTSILFAHKWDRILQNPSDRSPDQSVDPANPNARAAAADRLRRQAVQNNMSVNPAGGDAVGADAILANGGRDLNAPSGMDTTTAYSPGNGHGGVGGNHANAVAMYHPPGGPAALTVGRPPTGSTGTATGATTGTGVGGSAVVLFSRATAGSAIEMEVLNGPGAGAGVVNPRPQQPVQQQQQIAQNDVVSGPIVAAAAAVATAPRHLPLSVIPLNIRDGTEYLIMALAKQMHVEELLSTTPHTNAAGDLLRHFLAQPLPSPVIYRAAEIVRAHTATAFPPPQSLQQHNSGTSTQTISTPTAAGTVTAAMVMSHGGNGNGNSSGGINSTTPSASSSHYAAGPGSHLPPQQPPQHMPLYAPGAVPINHNIHNPQQIAPPQHSALVQQQILAAAGVTTGPLPVQQHRPSLTHTTSTTAHSSISQPNFIPDSNPGAGTGGAGAAYFTGTTVHAPIVHQPAAPGGHGSGRRVSNGHGGNGGPPTTGGFHALDMLTSSAAASTAPGGAGVPANTNPNGGGQPLPLPMSMHFPNNNNNNSNSSHHSGTSGTTSSGHSGVVSRGGESDVGSPAHGPAHGVSAVTTVPSALAAGAVLPPSALAAATAAPAAGVDPSAAHQQHAALLGSVSVARVSTGVGGTASRLPPLQPIMRGQAAAAAAASNKTDPSGQ